MRKTVLITGANAGIGFATALELAGRDHLVCLACRDPLKAAKARARIMQAHPWAQVEIFRLDLASFASIRQFVEVFSSQHDTLDALVNNAATVPHTLQRTQEGFEMQFGVNYLGHFLLTHLLLPMMQNAVALHGEARIVHLTSSAHMFGRVDESTFMSGGPRYHQGRAYAQSKLCNLLLNFALARRLPEGVTTQAVHPGRVVSAILRDVPRWYYALALPFLTTPNRAARLIADMATLRSHARRSGAYESARWCLLGFVGGVARDVALQERLYGRSCGLAEVDALPLEGTAGSPQRHAMARHQHR